MYQPRIEISQVTFKPGSKEAAASGLLGWVCFTVSGVLRLDGVALRRTLDERLALSFPARRACAGRQHKLVCPLNDGSRREIERQVFEALGFEESQPW